MKASILCLLSSLLLSMSVNAKVNVRTEFQRDIKGYPQAQVHNLMNETLACYVALDGTKRKFVLPPNTTSSWYTASDTRFQYTSFSTWCDFLFLHPEYEIYRTR